MRDGQKRRSERKFFPGYVLVEMDMDDESWHLVKDVPKVMGFIGGTADRPAPISEKEANRILQRVEERVLRSRSRRFSTSQERWSGSSMDRSTTSMVSLRK